MQIELDDEVQAALEKRASDAGMSLNRYVNLMMQEQLQQPMQGPSPRSTAIDELLERMKNSNSTSGRNGREWREFIHEGHTS